MYIKLNNEITLPAIIVSFGCDSSGEPHVTTTMQDNGFNYPIEVPTAIDLFEVYNSEDELVKRIDCGLALDYYSFDAFTNDKDDETYEKFYGTLRLIPVDSKKEVEA